MNPEFKEWPKTPRFFDTQIIVTEKIDGTNSQIVIEQELERQHPYNVYVGSRNRWITPEDDNYGFARWVKENEEEIIKLLGVGTHYGEWWGQGVQRKYGMDRKVFSLFNVGRWGELWNHDPGESICDVVPFKVFQLDVGGSFDEIISESTHYFMKKSRAAEKYEKEFTNPEGMCFFHERSQQVFKMPLNK